VSLGLDHPRGEGVMLFINPRMGYQGLVVNRPGKTGNRQRLFLGSMLSGDQARPGVLVLNRKDASPHTTISADAADALPTIKVKGRASRST